MRISFIIIFFINTVALAQNTRIVKDVDQEFLQARQYFIENKWTLAYAAFQKIKDRQNNLADRVDNYIHRQEIDFYNLVCALMLQEVGADARAKTFLEHSNNTVLNPQLYYYLGGYYFLKNDYAEAVEAYSKSSIKNLSNDQIAKKNFEEGYSWFTQKQFDKAKPLLNAIRQMPADLNYADANYYYGFIAFSEKDYAEALKSFEIVQEKGKHLNLVPFYITQIYYFQGQKDKAINAAEKALKQGDQYYDLELRQLLGHAYFEKEEYSKALPLLEKYVNSSNKVRREDLYELSFCYYSTNEYPKAISGFKQLNAGQDTLTQNAMYLLGDAYLKTNQKSNARNAFLFCSANSSNQRQKEISTFLFGKLSYELGYDNEALLYLKKYINDLNNKEFEDEAKDLLVSVLANTNNYKDALELYESLLQKSENNKRIYPRILYNRAQELINDQQTVLADQLLEKAEKASYNATLLPLIHFWRGEIAYRSERLGDAVIHLNAYLKNPKVLGEANPSNANYILGYVAIKNQDYKTALQYFMQVNVTDPLQKLDIQNRMADCYYMQKNFAKALELYNAVVDAKTSGSDYAIFQKGMIAGAQNHAAEKINLMRSIETSYPTSSYFGDAQMEIANTYLSDEEYAAALPYFDKIINDKNTEGLKPQAYLKKGITQYNLEKSEDALNTFKALLNKYPQSAESEDAIDNIRNIFIEQGKAAEYVQFIKSAGKNISSNEADSLTYSSANLQWNSGNKEKALEAFNQYLNSYPEGKYALQASFFLGQLLEEKKDIKNAAVRYIYVADKAPNKYAERAILFLARYFYFDEKDYTKAVVYYQKLKLYGTTSENKLEAMRGLLRCQYQLQQWTEALPNAQDILNNKSTGMDDKIFAYMIAGKNAQLNNDCMAAITAYKNVTQVSKAAYGSEARYEIAHCLFQQERFSDAEKAAFEVINKTGSYEDWVTRSYLLLGDIYLKQKDYFNAKATFKSVAENSNIEQFKREASEKYKQVEEAESGQSKVENNY